MTGTTVFQVLDAIHINVCNGVALFDDPDGASCYAASVVSGELK